ncbi:MAG: glycosyltransferase family 9 protein [Verrucomicrobiales bacterium]
MNAPSRDMLIAAPDRWDEACFSVPAVRALIASGLGIGMICQEEQVNFWKTIANLQVLDFPAKSSTRAIAYGLSPNWKAALIWQPGFATHAIKAAGIPQRLGPAHPKLAKILTQTTFISSAPLDHRVRFYLSAVEELGIKTRNPQFFAPAGTIDPNTPPLVLLCPESDFGPSHEWPLDRWIELTAKLVANQTPVRIASLRGNNGPANALAEALHLGEHLLNLADLGTALPQLHQQPVTVAVDGSLPHLASHAGSTCVTLFGPNNPAWKRPLGTRHIVVRKHAECAPCLLPKCPMDLRCQNELDVERVWNAVAPLVNRGTR